MTVIEEVAAERARQIEIEGWTHTHDDNHDFGELAAAGSAYALCAADQLHPGSQGDGGFHRGALPIMWPWDSTWWKPKGPRRDLIRAAALIVAEIEKLDWRFQRPGTIRFLPCIKAALRTRRSPSTSA